jgi:hypothetical protein
MKKRKRPSRVHNPRRIDILVPRELGDSAKEVLDSEGLSLSSYVRFCMRILIANPDEAIHTYRTMENTYGDN